MMQETPRKYTKPTYTKNYLRRDPRLGRKKDDAENAIMGNNNWRKVAQDRKG
jgi:hypothetical protein